MRARTRWARSRSSTPRRPRRTFRSTSRNSQGIDGINLEEHLIRQTVERELADLQKVLSQTRGVAEVVGTLPYDDDGSNPVKSRYWRLLTERASESDWWSALFSSGTEVNSEALLGGCADLLQRPLASVPAGGREVPGVPSEILLPEQTWSNSSDYRRTANKLAQLFDDNFQQYADEASDATCAAGPRVVQETTG